MGDSPDLDALIDRWRGPLVGLLRAWGAQDPIDVAADVFAEAWLGRARFTGRWEHGADVGPWLRGIAWNLTAAAARRRGRPAPVREDTPTTTAGPAEAIAAGDERAVIRAAIDALPADQRAAVWMHYLEGTPTAEIADLLGVPRSTVHGRLERARRALAGALGALVQLPTQGRTR
ncbi:MAG: sigma-70 family RNA polymerase sigma factor [Planctomycetota bacterium]